MKCNLQKPQIILPEIGQGVGAEVGVDFCDHFGVFDGDREVLLGDGFPVHAAELINLVDEVVDEFWDVEDGFVG